MLTARQDWDPPFLIQKFHIEMLLSGLDIVRRDWSQFAADAGKAVIDIIMTDKAQDTRLAEIQVTTIMTSDASH